MNDFEFNKSYLILRIEEILKSKGIEVLRIEIDSVSEENTSIIKMNLKYNINLYLEYSFENITLQKYFGELVSGISKAIDEDVKRIESLDCKEEKEK